MSKMGLLNKIIESGRKNFFDPHVGDQLGGQKLKIKKSVSTISNGDEAYSFERDNEIKYNIKREISMPDMSSIISEGSLLEGNISVSGIMKINGKIKGDISCDSDIIIGEGAEVEGDITCVNLQIAGLFRGNGEISGESLISSTGIVYGDLITGELTINGGANVNGSITMNSNNAKEEFQEKIAIDSRVSLNSTA